jgi:hypothetical protein
MASTSGAFSTYPSLLTYRVTADEVGTDESNNRSLVLVRAYIDFSGSSASSSGGSGSTTAGSWSRGFTSFSGGGSIEVYNSGNFYVAHNADGSGSYSFSGSASMSGWGTASTGTGTLTLSDFTRTPLAPASCTVSVSGRNATVTSGTSDATGRPAVTSYQVERTNNDGSTWSGSVYTMDGSRQYVYSSLDGGKYYKFRTRAVNSEGAGAWTESSSTFIPAGGRRWDGSAWSPTTIAKRWDGSAWVDLTIAKRWDGSAWVDLS